MAELLHFGRFQRCVSRDAKQNHSTGIPFAPLPIVRGPCRSRWSSPYPFPLPLSLSLSLSFSLLRSRSRPLCLSFPLLLSRPLFLSPFLTFPLFLSSARPLDHSGARMLTTPRPHYPFPPSSSPLFLSSSLFLPFPLSSVHQRTHLPLQAPWFARTRGQPRPGPAGPPNP